MPAYKEKDRNTWAVKFKHRNWSGKIKWVTKRGFATKREALQYERDFLARKSGDLDMSFADFVQVYREERGARIKESTLSMKDNIIDTKLIPYFGAKCMREITTKDIMLWQNELLTYSADLSVLRENSRLFHPSYFGMPFFLCSRPRQHRRHTYPDAQYSTARSHWRTDRQMDAYGARWRLGQFLLFQMPPEA